MTPDELRSLIEDAAKAAGYTWVRPTEAGEFWWHENPDLARPWNPTTSRSDCFDLETALGLEVAWFEFAVSFRTDCRDQSYIERFSDHSAPTLNESKSLARMMAATRAAAEIFRSMKK